MRNINVRKPTQELMHMKPIELFGLSRNFTLEELKRQRKKLRLLYHPDKLTKTNLSPEEQEICLKGGFMGAFVYIDNEYKKLVTSFEEKHSFSAESSQFNQKKFPPKSAPATQSSATPEFLSIKKDLKKGILNNFCFINEKALDRVVAEISQGNFSLQDMQNWENVRIKFWMDENTWKLIDSNIFTISDAASFSTVFLEKIPTFVISQLLLHKILTLDNINLIRINDTDILNNEHIYWIIKEKPDLKSIIFNLPYDAPFFQIIVGKAWNKLDKVFTDFLAEIFIANKITLENFSEFSALELMLIGMGLYSYEEIRQIPPHRRAYLKGLDILSLIFTDSYKNTNLLTEKPASIPLHYSIDFLFSLSDEHLSFISKNIYRIRGYNITPQHLSALPPQEMQEINTEFLLIDNDMRLERHNHEDGKPSVNNQRYGTIINNQILNRLENTQTSSVQLPSSMQSTSLSVSKETNQELSDADLAELMNEFSNENQDLFPASKNTHQESKTDETKFSSYINQTFLGKRNNEQEETVNQESKQNTQESYGNTEENLNNNQKRIIS